MFTVTVPRSDVTLDEVSAALRAKLGPRYNIRPSMRSTGFGKEVPGDARWTGPGRRHGAGTSRPGRFGRTRRWRRRPGSARTVAQQHGWLSPRRPYGYPAEVGTAEQ